MKPHVHSIAGYLFGAAFLLLLHSPGYGQVPNPVSDINGHMGIGTVSPDRSALLDLTASDAGLLLTRVTLAQRDAIVLPATSLLLFNTSDQEFQYNAGTPQNPLWTGFLSRSTAQNFVWTLQGNSGVDPASSFLGTTDGTPIALRTDGIERMRISADGNVGIGTVSPAPSALLDLSSTNSGFLPPRMALSQRNAITSPAKGLLVYNTSSDNIDLNVGTEGAPDWRSLLTDGDAWLTSGNNATGTEVLGTLNGQNLRIVAGGTTRITVAYSNGHVGIGASPSGSQLNVGGVINTSIHYSIGEDRVLSNPGTDNIFVGVDAGSSNNSGTSNSFVGKSAGSNNFDGFFNSFFGASSGRTNTSGSDNTFAGYASGRNNSTGDFNTMIGALSGMFNDVGNNNTFAGALAGMMSNGDDNTFVGISAGQLNTSGGSNVFVGSNSGFSNDAGSNNTFVGVGSGNLNIGDNNTFFGFAAGGLNETGNYNVYLGNSATGDATTTSSIAIGFNAHTTADHQLVVGSNDPAGQVDDSYWGNGVVSITPLPFTFHATGAVGKDIGGAALRIAGGQGTGTGTGGNLVFQTAPSGASGINQNALVDRMTITSQGNVGIGTTAPGGSNLLELTSTTKGFVLPRMTKAQRNAIGSPVAGMMVYQTDNTPGLRVYNGTNWMRFTETADP